MSFEYGLAQASSKQQLCLGQLPDLLSAVVLLFKSCRQVFRKLERCSAGSNSLAGHLLIGELAFRPDRQAMSGALLSSLTCPLHGSVSHKSSTGQASAKKVPQVLRSGIQKKAHQALCRACHAEGWDGAPATEILDLLSAAREDTTPDHLRSTPTDQQAWGSSGSNSWARCKKRQAHSLWQLLLALPCWQVYTHAARQQLNRMSC